MAHTSRSNLANPTTLFAALACVFAVNCLAAPPKSEPGLLARLTDGAYAGFRIVPDPNFSLKAEESIDPRLTSSFTANWMGSLNIVKRERYTLTLDGAAHIGKLSIDGKPVGSDAIELDVGEHPIVIDYVRKSGPARMQLVWSADDFLPESVPQTALSHAPQATGEESDRGRLLVESLNCIACHPTASRDIVGRKAPALTAAGDRLKPAWIKHWLDDPRAYRLNAMMPRVPLDAEQRGDVAAYLATLKDPASKIKEQNSKPADHVASGKWLFENVGCTSCHDKLEGEASPAKYSLGGIGSKWHTGQLAAYLQNPLAIDHSGRMPSMLLSGDEARNLAEYLTGSHDAQFEAATTQPAESIVRGKQIVRAQGCVRCHSIEKSQPVLEATAVALEDLHEGKGCLAEKPTGKAMDYGLSPEQRKSIFAFVEAVRKAPLVSASPAAAFYHKVATLGCTNCHELNGVKPAEETERIPPLTSVGARLRTEWINSVLTERRRVRPWLHRRMPDFGKEAVGDLAELATAVSGVGPAEPLPTPTRDETIAGQTIVGSGGQGLSCITCHGFNGVKPAVADDTRGPDITTVAARLRPDHFRRWVYDPKRVNPATPMPSFFDGVPAHDAAGKIETIFRYCALGTAMPPPFGWIDENNYTLAVRETPVIQRCVMPNLNGGHNFPRGVAVGLPGLVNYCFDADSCTVRYAWSGGFIDMQPAWSGRGGNEVRVQGKAFWGTSFAPIKIGNTDAKPHFNGYALLPDGSPQWLYRIGEADVRESIRAVQRGFGIVRSFEVDAQGQAVTVTIVDHDNVDVQCSAGPMELTTVGLDANQSEKKPAHRKTFKGDEAIKFSLTITSKESK